MIFAKEFASACITIGMGVGCFVGGLSIAWRDYSYERAMQDPGFFYLVDEAGNPVRQKSD